jgi:hypothetical protein
MTRSGLQTSEIACGGLLVENAWLSRAAATKAPRPIERHNVTPLSINVPSEGFLHALLAGNTQKKPELPCIAPRNEGNGMGYMKVDVE